MNQRKVYSIVFSPTGTSAKIAAAVVGAMGGNTEKIDLTHSTNNEICLPESSVAVIAIPVYGGHVAPEAIKRLQAIRGQRTPAVLIVVYGNRAFDAAATELAAFASAQGFVPVAVAAFVGEHSYSTPATPIAEGRPDAQDLTTAAAFGAQVCEKLAQKSIVPVDAAKLREPHTPLWPKLRFIRFVLGYRRRQRRNPVVLLPAGDTARCTQCGRCVAVCPTQAIERGNECHTDPTRCIRCCACIKACAFGARSFETPFAATLSQNFTRRKPPVTLL